MADLRPAGEDEKEGGSGDGTDPLQPIRPRALWAEVMPARRAPIVRRLIAAHRVAATWHEMPLYFYVSSML